MLLTTIHSPPAPPSKEQLERKQKEILSRGNISATFFVRKGSQLPFKSHETNTTQIHVEKHSKNKKTCLQDGRTFTQGSREHASAYAPSLIYSIALTSVCLYMLIYSLNKVSVRLFYQLISPMGLGHCEFITDSAFL